MSRVNKVILVGNCGRDSEIGYLTCRQTFVTKQVRIFGQTPIVSISDDMPESGGGAAAGVPDGPDVAASDDDDGGEGDPDRRSRRASRTRNPQGSAEQRSSSTNKRRDGAVNQLTSNPCADAQPNATPAAGALPSPQNPDIALWRLPTVLAHVPVSRSHWWAGVAEGRYPAPVRLSKRCVAWRSAEIRALIASF